MAQIEFYANENGMAGGDAAIRINHTSGSGIGFFGGGFGISVPVGGYQDTTYVTNGDGTASGIRCNNTKWLADNTYPNSGVSSNGGSLIQLRAMPNYYAPLNIRFTHDEAVRVQNCKLRIFDRSDISQTATGVTTQVFECRHPHPVEGYNAGTGTLAFRGVTDYGWSECDPAEAQFDINFTPSPGATGLNTSAADTLPATATDGNANYVTKEGAAHESARHDWYVALSASPDSIGSKTQYGLYFTLEYL